MFETAMGMVECSVVLRTTKAKAKTPVSEPPPNSIDSEAEEDTSGDAQLSQSTTYTGVCIELPEGVADVMAIQTGGGTNGGAQTDVGNIKDELPEMPGEVVTPATTGSDKGRSAIGVADKELTGTDTSECAWRKIDVTPRSVV